MPRNERAPLPISWRPAHTALQRVDCNSEDCAQANEAAQGRGCALPNPVREHEQGEPEMYYREGDVVLSISDAAAHLRLGTPLLVWGVEVRADAHD